MSGTNLSNNQPEAFVRFNDGLKLRDRLVFQNDYCIVLATFGSFQRKYIEQIKVKGANGAAKTNSPA